MARGMKKRSKKKNGKMMGGKMAMSMKPKKAKKPKVKKVQWLQRNTKIRKEVLTKQDEITSKEKRVLI